MIELCGRCGHGLEGHINAPCRKDNPNGQRCACEQGVRTDALLNLQMTALIKKIDDLLKAVSALVILAQAATGIEIKETEEGAEADRPRIVKV